MSTVLDDPRVLVCGWRDWPWPQAVDAALDQLQTRYGDRLVVIEGAARGADAAAHNWCLRQRWDHRRHRCHPVNWPAERRARPTQWRQAGPERNTRMLRERPRLILAFHPHLDPWTGGTSDMCLRGLLAEVAVWAVTGPDATRGRWLSLEAFPAARVARVRADLHRPAH